MPNPKDTRADDDTPIPKVEIERVDEELREYLKFKRVERNRGFTLESLFNAIQTLSDGLADTVRRTGLLEEWRRQHTLEHELEKQTRTALSPPRSLPPMRNAMDTDSFKVNVRDLELALEVEREKFRAYEKAKMQEQIVELKTNSTWWREHGIKWLVSGVGAVVMLAIGWLISLLGRAK